MTRRAAQPRQGRPSFVDADPLSDAPDGVAGTTRSRARSPRAIPRDPDDGVGAQSADGADPRPPRGAARARVKASDATDAGDSSSPRRSSPRARSGPGSSAPPGDSGGSRAAPIPSSRALAPAQPVTRKETALVTRQTERVPGLGQTTTTKAVTVVGPGGRETTVLPAPARPRAAVALPVFAPASPLGRRRHPLGLMLFIIAAVAALGGALYSVSPLSPIRGHDSVFAPSAALLALNPESRTTGGAWDTSAGAAALGQGGGAGPGVSAPGSAGLPSAGGGATWDFSASPGAVFVSAAPVSPWPPADPYMAVPGHPAFRVNPGDYYPWAFGQCTWWASFDRRDENLSYLGDAKYWAAGAAERGLRVGMKAAPDATVVFHPGAQGAGGAGHVGHVEAVYPDGWFLISEMNFYWNGGGWGRVDYRFAHEGWGVAFIY